MMNRQLTAIIQPSDTKQAKEIVILLQKTITELCGPDYDNDKVILNDWLQNKTEANITEWIENKNTDAVSAVFENKIVGFGLSAIDGEILLLYTLPEFKGKHIGKSMYLYLEERLLHQDIKKVITYSTITAKPFYLKMGFKQFGSPVKVGRFDGEFPLEKNLAT